VGVPQIPSGAPWTIEMWVYYSSARSNTNLLLQALPTNVGSNSQGINLATRGGSNTLYLYLGSDFYNVWDIASAQTSSVNLTVSAWNHVALVFTGSASASPSYTLYVGGVAGITIASGVPILKETWANMTLSDCTTSQAWNGYIDDFRISTTARYSTAFTPPGALTWDRNTHYLNSFNGSNNATNFSAYSLVGPYNAAASTDSSIVLSTTQFKYGSSALSIPNGGATALLCSVPPPADAWTVEGWFYASSNTTGNVLFCGFDGASYRGVVVQFNGSNRTLTATLSMNLNAGLTARELVVLPAGLQLRLRQQLARLRGRPASEQLCTLHQRLHPVRERAHHGLEHSAPERLRGLKRLNHVQRRGAEGAYSGTYVFSV
jgi:hypothetical protein